MTTIDPLAELIRADRDALSNSAPPRHFPGLWDDVLERRAARFEAQAIFSMVVAAALLFLFGAAGLLAIGGLHVTLPCWLLSCWFAFEALRISPRRRTRSATFAPT